jgi:hypothetical protein
MCETSFYWYLENYKMGSQKVPETVILHCNATTYCNAYLISFKVGALRTRTHTHARTYAPSILPLLEEPAKDFVGAFHGILPHVALIRYRCSQHVGGFRGRLPHLLLESFGVRPSHSI